MCTSTAEKRGKPLTPDATKSLRWRNMNKLRSFPAVASNITNTLRSLRNCSSLLSLFYLSLLPIIARASLNLQTCRRQVRLSQAVVISLLSQSIR